MCCLCMPYLRCTVFKMQNSCLSQISDAFGQWLARPSEPKYSHFMMWKQSSIPVMLHGFKSKLLKQMDKENFPPLLEVLETF